MSLQALKNLNLDRVIDIDEAVALSAEARALETEHAALELPTPEWLTKSTDVLRQEIERRTRAGDLAELKRIEAELEGYKTIGEKRNEAARRLTMLKAKLGVTQKASQ